MCSKYTNFLFDLDGTLVDSFGDIQSSLEKAYQLVLGREVVVQRNLIGPPLGAMIDSLTPAITTDEKNTLIRAYRTDYDSSMYDRTTEMTGAFDLLHWLHRQDKQLFLVTNKSYKPTQRILSKFNISLFKDVMSPDKFEGKHYSKTELIQFLIDTYCLNLQETVMLGDTRHDVIAAKACAIDSICISGGYDDYESLKKENPTYIIDKIFQLK